MNMNCVIGEQTKLRCVEMHKEHNILAAYNMYTANSGGWLTNCVPSSIVRRICAFLRIIRGTDIVSEIILLVVLNANLRNC